VYWVLWEGRGELLTVDSVVEGEAAQLTEHGAGAREGEGTVDGGHDGERDGDELNHFERLIGEIG